MREHIAGAIVAVGFWIFMDMVRKWVAGRELSARPGLTQVEHVGPLPRKAPIAKGAKLKPKTNDDLAAWQLEQEREEG